MKLNMALALLAKAPAGSSISRPDGPKVRYSVGAAEHALHRYVVDTIEGVQAFDASEEDLAAEDWGPILVGAKPMSRASSPSPTVPSKPTAQPLTGLARAKAEAEAKAKAEEEARELAELDKLTKPDTKAETTKGS
jgi:hypothetical protein